MITGLIVTAALVFAAVFFLVWLLKREFRQQVELPKHEFQEQLRRYDRQCRSELQGSGTGSDGSE